MKIDIPDFLSHLTVFNGFPVPYTVLIDGTGKPQFKINSDTKTWECIKENKCIVCGRDLGKDLWVIGGQLSTFHSNGMFNDPPCHKQCAEFALKFCPFMCNGNYKHTGNYNINEPLILVDPTLDSRRLSFMCLVNISAYNIVPSGLVFYVKPDKPYLKVEYWRDGQRISMGDARRLLKNNNEKCYLP